MMTASSDDGDGKFDPTKIPLGTEIGNFRLEELIGEGGFGAVFRARNKLTKTDVAIKFLKTAGLSPDAVTRFNREAFLSNDIGNPHVVGTHDMGEYNGCPYIIMEYLKGTPLRKEVETFGVLPAERVRNIAVQVAEALEAAHSRGIIHRDLKPDNIFLISQSRQADFVKVLDFGLAKLTQELPPDKLKTESRLLMGTPYFMSPEQCRSAHIDKRSDVYALGVNLFYMLVGRVPFEGAGYGDILLGHLSDPVPPLPRTGDRAVPPALIAIVMKSLQKKAEDRYQSMEEMRDALIAARLTARGGLGLPMAISLSVLALGGVAYWGLHRQPPAPAPAPAPVGPSPNESKTEALESFRAFVQVLPPDATLTVDGSRRSVPTVLEGTTGRRFHIEAVRSGYQPKSQEVTIGKEDQRVALKLDAVENSGSDGDSTSLQPPAEPKKQELTKLIVSVQPWADVFVDGAKKEQAPCSLRVPVGTHKITLVNGALRRREDIKITLVAGATKKIDRDWRP
jgi:serine/threonine protein kinase